MSILLYILGTFLYLAIGFSCGVALYTFIKIIDEDDVDCFEDDTDAYITGAFCFLWPLGVIFIIGGVVFIYTCFLINKVSDMVIEMRTKNT